MTIEENKENPGENDIPRVYLGGIGGDQEDIVDTTRVMGEFDSSTSINTLIFSNLRVDKAFDNIKDWLRDNDIKPDVHEKRWKLVYTRTQKLDDEEKELEI